MILDLARLNVALTASMPAIAAIGKYAENHGNFASTADSFEEIMQALAFLVFAFDFAGIKQQ